jgi:hypothetical protein
VKEENLGIGGFQELSDEDLLNVSGGGLFSTILGTVLGGVLSPITSTLSGLLKGGVNIVGSLFSVLFGR